MTLLAVICHIKLNKFNILKRSLLKALTSQENATPELLMLWYIFLFHFSMVIFNSHNTALLEYRDDPNGNKVIECLPLWGALDLSGHLSPFSKLLL